MNDLVHSILSANSGVTDDVSDQIYTGEVEKGVTRPFILIGSGEQEAPPDRDLSNLDMGRFSVFIYADRVRDGGGVVGVFDLASNVRTALDHYNGTVDGTEIECLFERQSGIFHEQIGNDRRVLFVEQEYQYWVNV